MPVEVATLPDLRWDLLEITPPSGERLVARLAMPNRRSDVFIAVDSIRRRHVLVAIPHGEPCELAERTSIGIAVQAVEMNVGEGQFGNFVEIACLDSQGHAALDVVIGELVDALQAGASIGRVRLVQNVLAKWRRFWSGVRQGLLSREQQLGLFGELWFLHHWLVPSVGLVKAVQMWRGPLGARNDFEARALGIEVKTTSRLDGSHIINGLEQLLEPPGGALLFFTLTVRDEASGNQTLASIVDAFRGLLADDYSTILQFESTLYASGYDERHASEYNKLVLRIREEGLYRVTGDFPRLIPESLSLGLPRGVGAVSYELRLDGAASWLLARTPVIGAALLQDFAK
jgi:hypothetical protein